MYAARGTLVFYLPSMRQTFAAYRPSFQENPRSATVGGFGMCRKEKAPHRPAGHPLPQGARVQLDPSLEMDRSVQHAAAGPPRPTGESAAVSASSLTQHPPPPRSTCPATALHTSPTPENTK